MEPVSLPNPTVLNKTDSGVKIMSASDDGRLVLLINRRLKRFLMLMEQGKVRRSLQVERIVGENAYRSYIYIGGWTNEDLGSELPNTERLASVDLGTLKCTPTNLSKEVNSVFAWSQECLLATKADSLFKVHEKSREERILFKTGIQNLQFSNVFSASDSLILCYQRPRLECMGEMDNPACYNFGLFDMEEEQILSRSLLKGRQLLPHAIALGRTSIALFSNTSTEGLSRDMILFDIRSSKAVGVLHRFSTPTTAMLTRKVAQNSLAAVDQQQVSRNSLFSFDLRKGGQPIQKLGSFNHISDLRLTASNKIAVAHQEQGSYCISFKQL